MSDVALRFGAKDDGLDAKFTKVTKQLKELQTGSNKVAGLIGTSFDNLGKIVASVSIAKLTAEAVEFASALVKVSAQTGLSIDAIQRLQFIASQTTVSFDSITRAVNLLQRELVNGGASAQKALGQLGISLHEIDQLSPDQQFGRIAQGISAIEDPAKRTAVAMDLFGRRGADLLPILTQTGAQMDELNERFKQLGGPVSADTVRKLDDLGNSFSALKDAAKFAGVELLSLVAAPLTKLLQGLGSVIGAARDAGHSLRDELFLDTQSRTLEQELESINRQLLQMQDVAKSGRVFAIDPMGGWVNTDDILIRKNAQIITGLQARKAEIEGIMAMQAAFSDVPEIAMPKIAGLDVGDGKSATEDAVMSMQERRLAAMEQDRNMLQDLGLEMVEFNQGLLDQMLLADTEAMASRVEIESEGARLRAEIRETFGLQEVSLEQAKAQSIYGIATGLFGALARENSKFAKVQQALAIAETIWSTAKGIMHAMSQLPWPANLAAAASVAAMGAVNVAKIKATNYSSGGSAPSFSGSSAMGGSTASNASDINQQQPTGVQAQSTVQVVFTGDTYGFDDFGDKVVRAIQENVNDRDVVIISPQSRQAIELAPA